MNDARDQPLAGASPPANAAATAARAARSGAALVAAAFAALGGALVAVLAAAEPWRPAHALLITRGSGWLACSALLIALAVTPVGQVAAARRALGNKEAAADSPAKPRWRLPAIPARVLRRAFGLCAALLGGLHAALAWQLRLDGNARAIVQSAQLLAGLSALGLLALLALTSFDGAIRGLRLRYWNELHRSAYAAALLVAQHVLLGPFASRRLALGLLAGVGLLLAARLLPRRTAR